MSSPDQAASGDWDALPYFVGCYLNMDWPDDYDGDPLGAARAFVRNERPDVRRALVAEIDALLAEGRTERELSELVVDVWNSYYRAGGRRRSASTFLLAVRSIAGGASPPAA